jgi:hypothetical protein
VLFLSYAEEDGATADRIATWFRERGEPIWRVREDGQIQNVGGIEEQLGNAHHFVALLSPGYMASALCRGERDLAWCREQGARMASTSARFFYVLRLADTAGPSTCFPPQADWIDLTEPQYLNSALRRLSDRISTASPPDGASSEMTGPGPAAPLFRNRVDELNAVLQGLTNFAGPHFWLVIAPPQLGKTWFLDRIGAELALGQRHPWQVRLVDLREQPVEVRADALALLRAFFGADMAPALDADSFRQIAQKIVRSGRPHLCLLDNAELLPEETAITLRWCFGEVFDQVRLGRRPGIRVALVAASRRDDAWRGVNPAPRMTMLSLTEFRADVIEQALRDLARKMDVSVDEAEIALVAELARDLSEGLPALIVRCLAWIRSESWLGLDRLGLPATFRDFAGPYIRDILLSQGSLFPLSEGQYEPQSRGHADEPSRALGHAFRVLAPYRLFTQSHVRYHWDSDPDFHRSVEDLDWSMEDLWRAIGGTALLLRPLNEPWQQIPAPVRRLLYRYHYPSADQRAAAHREARKFVEVWAEKQQGKEQIIGLVECLWHEAAGQNTSRPSEMETALIASARSLSMALRESHAYTADELRDYAAQRMADDEELRRMIGDDGLFNRLITIVLRPDEEL